MKTLKLIECRIGIAAAAVAITLLLTGCSSFKASTSTPTTIHGASFHGSLFGGRQPVSGAAITFYAAATTGYSAATPNILTTTVLTDANGNFNVTGDYTCTAGQQMYLVATGGNPGAGTNANAAFLSALGDCANLTVATYVSMNEVTTVGSVFALAPFMSSYTALGSSSTNTAGLARAFASVNKLVNIGSGASTGSALPANAVGPAAEINTLGDILANCVNSTGGTAGDGSACGSLFTLATPAGGTVPTNTIQAALNIARNPTLNTTALYNSSPAVGPYQPQLPIAPTDWTMGIKYKNIGLNNPKSATVDALGQVWFVNSNSNANSVTVLAQTGAPIAASPLTGNSLNVPLAVAIDSTGNAWVANQSNTLSVFTSAGAASANYNAGNQLNNPNALAFDATGNLWITNGNNNSLVEVNAAGTLITTTGTNTNGLFTPTAVVINSR